MDELEKMLLMQIADLHKVPDGAYNIRNNGEAEGRRSTPHIRIEPRKDGKSGIDIFISGKTQGESVHIPVVITKTDYRETVYNDFYVEDGADVLIIAGCGIHNCGQALSEHSGIHTFHVGKNAKVKYVEKHYASGDGNGENVMNPTTDIRLEEGARMEMETTQIKGVDSTVRVTRAQLAADAELVIREKIYTHGKQFAKTDFSVTLDGENAGADIVSRSVAAQSSRQELYLRIDGNKKCHGHSECDAIIMDDAKVLAIPALAANNVDAELIHEAAIGKIAGEQLLKLMTLGLTEQEAEEQIIKGFLS